MTLTDHKNRRVQYLATLSVSMASFTQGISAGWATPVLPKLKEGSSIEISDAELGWMVAMASPGVIVGCLVMRFLADRLGRRSAVLLTACPIVVGMIVVVFALKAWLLYMGRFLGGVGAGMITALLPIYIGEISDSEVRATLSLFTRVMFNLGNLLVMSIGMFVSYECLNYMLLVFPAVHFLACLWIPESPYYLLKINRVGEAKKALAKIRQLKDEKMLEDEVSRLQADVRNETRRSGSFKELMTGRQYRKAVIIAAVSMASFTQGISAGWATPVLPKLKEGSSIEISDAELGWMVAMASPGVIVGCLVMRFLADRLGRRSAVLLTACPIVVGMIVVVFALKAWLLYMGRFLGGVGAGMITALLPIYIGEISDSEVRATLSLFTRVMFNLGNLLVMSIGMFVSYECLNYMLLVFPAVHFLACLWIPESPYYLLKINRVGEAKKALAKIRQLKDEKMLEDEVSRLQADVRNETRRSGSFKELMTGRQYRKAVIIAAGLKIIQFMTGSLVIQRYLGIILEESKIKMQLSTAVIVFGVVRFIVGIMSSILVGRVGRRPLLMYSLLGTGVSLTAVSIYFFLKENFELAPETLSPYAFIPFAGIITCCVLSFLGYSSIIFVIPGEIFPFNVKAVAMSSLSIFGGILSFTVSKGFQVVKDLAGLCAVFWVFAGVAFAGTIFTMLYVPETKGKSLKEIQILLQGDLYYDEGREKLKNNEHEDGIEDVKCKV